MVTNLEQLYQELNFIDKKEFVRFSNLSKNSFDELSLRYKNALEEMKPEAMFCLQNEPLILFFNLENSNSVDEDISKIHRQAWNFDKAPVVVISTSSDIIFYNAFNFDTNEHKLSILTKNKQDFQNFAYENLYSGSLFDRYKNKFVEKNRVNNLLFQHIKDYRAQLISEGLNSTLANSLLARVIFLKYLQDREIIVDNENHNIIKESFENKTRLYSLFRSLKEKFNGDLFDIELEEENIISDNNIITIRNFANSTSIYGQMRLLPFDFSIIPIELVSSIYETFLNAKQAEIKAYYTPTFLVDYMINTTITPFLNDLDKTDSNCKVLDPACGSGIFLIEALRKIINKEEQINHNKKITPERLKELVENNIFGIDKDESAINIAIFSLYITLLDYQDPRSLLDFTFPHLKNKNFFVDDFFNTSGSFNKTLKDINVILSNPPYGSIKDKHQQWAKNNSISISDNQIAQSFLARIKDFSTDSTNVSMVVTSKILYNANANEFRKYFLYNFCIKSILELSSVRRLIFTKAIPPVCVINYKYKQDSITNLGNTINYLTLKPSLFFKYFKTLLIEKQDEKRIKQSILYKYDWLWKILLYGSILDFYFIKRLKEQYKSLNDLTTLEGLSSRQGLIINGNGNYDSTHLIGLPFLDTKKKILDHFCINLTNTEKFNKSTVHRVRTEDVYKGEKVLLKRGLDSNLSCVAAYSDSDIVFTNSINSIKINPNSSTDILLNIAGLFNSDLYTYLNLLMASAVGVERNEIYENEYLTYPYQFDNDIINFVKKLDCRNLSNYKNINTYINRVFNLSDLETDLIDYALNISIPIWKYGDNPTLKNVPIALQNATKEQFMDYANVFIETFSEEYQDFYVDIHRFKYCTLFNFKARQSKSTRPQIEFIEDSNIENIVKQISNYSLNDITNKIFIKKDIKGFNENSFFVIKTNEYKNWHKAIARLDVNEFSNAIWEAELEL